MNQIAALQQLRAVGAPVLESRDVSAILNVTASNATTILRRLAAAGLVTPLSWGRWLIDERIDPYALPELISAPWPSYVSLQSALFLHGLIEQIPSVVYAVTLGRTRQVRTPLATLSYHRLPPALFDGFELSGAYAAKVATPEKALFDLFYLTPARSRLFAALPEVTLPRRFRWSVLEDALAKVPSRARQACIARRMENLRASTRPH